MILLLELGLHLDKEHVCIIYEDEFACKEKLYRQCGKGVPQGLIHIFKIIIKDVNLLYSSRC